jgi:hypothetical protein
VLPSRSVNRKATVPVGRSARSAIAAVLLQRVGDGLLQGHGLARGPGGGEGGVAQPGAEGLGGLGEARALVCAGGRGPRRIAPPGAIRTVREEIQALVRELDRLERDAAALAAALDRALAAEAEAERRRHTRLVLAAWARRGAWRWN